MFKNIIKKETYKEISKVGKRYKVQWDKQAIMIPEYDSGGTKTGEHEDENLVTCMEEMYDYKPGVSQLKDVINGYYNTLINNEIVLGFVYDTGSGVTLYPYLSNENQINYKNAYDMIMNGTTAQYFLPYRIKNSNGHEPEYYDFTTSESFGDFYISMLAYIQSELNKAWEIKDNIDWSKYEYTEDTDDTSEETEVYNNGIIIEETSESYPDPSATGGTIDDEIVTATTTTSTKKSKKKSTTGTTTI